MRLSCSCCVLMLILSLPSAAGTSSHALAGAVRDTSGAVIPEANITLYGPESEWRSSTDSLGRFEVKGLPPGTYDLEVVKPHFSSVELDSISVEKDVVLRPIALKIQTPSEACTSSTRNYDLEYRNTMGNSVAPVIGRVKSHDGKLIPHAKVVVAIGDKIAKTHSSNDGSFAVPLQPTKRLVAIVVNARGFVPTQIPRVHLRPNTQATLTVFLAKRSGQPILCQ